MVPLTASQWTPVMALQACLETWRLLLVLWVPLVTYLYDLLVCICQSCLLDSRIFFLFCVIIIEKWDFIVIILQYFEKISWHHHNKQLNVWGFSTDPSLPDYFNIWYNTIPAGVYVFKVAMATPEQSLRSVKS